jgi:hypothetical protein
MFLINLAHSRVGSWSCLQTTDWAGKACQGANTLAYISHDEK